MPEFLYQALYDPKHRFLAVPLSEGEETTVHQKGFREELLCAPCEQRLGVYERYASQLLFHKPVVSWKEEERLIVIGGVDYPKFKLFLLSLLWRAGVSSRPEFSAVSLGPHERMLREQLLNDDPGPANRYASLISAFPIHSDIVNGSILPFMRVRIRGLRAYRAIFGGFLWHFVVASVGDQLRASNLSLSESGELRVHVLTPESADSLLRRVAAWIPDES